MTQPPPGRRFTRRIEDFDCENCGETVTGDGYTNHCPRCLFSKHVDVHPGDRRADCAGLMEPVEVAVEGGEYWIRHRCTKCGFERRNRSASGDDFESLLVLSVGRTPRPQR